MNKYKIVCDGGSLGNPGKGYGSYVVTGVTVYPSGPPLKIEASRIDLGDHLTCNQAEYLILITCLKRLRHLIEKPCEIAIYSDSKLMVMQLNGHWKCRIPHLNELLYEARELLNYSCDMNWIAYWHSRNNSVKKFGH